MSGRTIAIFTQGSRGDVQPYLALAMALQARGHSITLAAPDDFEDRVKSAGIDFAPMGTNMQDLLARPDIRKILAGNPLGIRKIWRTVAVPMLQASLKTIWQVGQDADVLVHHPKVVGAADVAEVTGAPVVLASPVPMVPTRAFPIITLSRDLGKRLNKLTWLPLRWARSFYGRQLGEWRQSVLGLPRKFRPRKGADPWYGADLRLVGVSQNVLPYPSDWDKNTILTGYWTLPTGSGWQPDPVLEAFLDDGPPPVYIGFGSMPVDDPEAVTRSIAAAVEKVGIRAVIGAGWAGIGDTNRNGSVFSVDSVPHDWLFQRVAAVVHHGGAGTTAAGLIAGKPSLICPAGVDQPFWAGRVKALGCGPEALPLKKLTTERLAERLRDLTATRSYADRATSLAEALAAEDGIARAVERIEAAMTP